MLEKNETITSEDWFKQINEKFTPNTQQQLVNILSGVCPHNQGYYPFGLNHKSWVYKCVICGDIKFL